MLKRFSLKKTFTLFSYSYSLFFEISMSIIEKIHFFVLGCNPITHRPVLLLLKVSY